jgi:hypothetical protein
VIVDHQQGLRDGVEELVKLRLHRGSVGLVVDRVPQAFPPRQAALGQAAIRCDPDRLKPGCTSRGSRLRFVARSVLTSLNRPQSTCRLS